ncbi:MAG: hypothetical protein RJA09_1328 [Pseudomonadota bacterium]
MLYNLLKTAHVLSILLWVGGMLFAHFFLRPAATELEPPVRLRLMQGVLQRFFAAVLPAALLAFVTGFWMMGRVAKEVVQSGGVFQMPLDWWYMAVLGTAMVAIFGHIRFALFKRLSRAVSASDWAAGGQAMAALRLWVSINLAIGLSIVVLVLVY